MNTELETTVIVRMSPDEAKELLGVLRATASHWNSYVTADLVSHLALRCDQP